MADHRANRTRPCGGLKVSVAVKVLPAQRDEQLTGCETTRIGRNRRDRTGCVALKQTTIRVGSDLL